MDVKDIKMDEAYEQLMCYAFQCNSQKYRFANKHYFKGRWKHPKALAAYLQCAMIVLRNRYAEDVDYVKCTEMLHDKTSKANIETILRVMYVKLNKSNK